LIDIDPGRLSTPEVVQLWTCQQYTAALRHIPNAPKYNSSFRQLQYVGFKMAARMGQRYLDLVEADEAVISWNVFENLYARHITPHISWWTMQRKYWNN
jgi:hypothetical protein